MIFNKHPCNICIVKSMCKGNQPKEQYTESYEYYENQNIRDTCYLYQKWENKKKKMTNIRCSYLEVMFYTGCISCIISILIDSF